jgi:hypothetical protein
MLVSETLTTSTALELVARDLNGDAILLRVVPLRIAADVEPAAGWTPSG